MALGPVPSFSSAGVSMARIVASSSRLGCSFTPCSSPLRAGGCCAASAPERRFPKRQRSLLPESQTTFRERFGGHCGFLSLWRRLSRLYGPMGQENYLMGKWIVAEYQ